MNPNLVHPVINYNSSSITLRPKSAMNCLGEYLYGHKRTPGRCPPAVSCYSPPPSYPRWSSPFRHKNIDPHRCKGKVWPSVPSQSHHCSRSRVKSTRERMCCTLERLLASNSVQGQTENVLCLCVKLEVVRVGYRIILK